MGTLLDKLSEEDNESARDALFKVYGPLTQFGFLYPNLTTTKWRIITVLQFIFYLLAYSSNMVLQFMTAINITEDQVLLIQALHFTILEFVGIIAVLAMSLQRRIVCRIYAAFAKGMSSYDDEMNEFKRKFQQDVDRKLKLFKIIVPIYFTFVGVGFVIISPLVDYLLGLGYPSIYSTNGVSLNIPIPIWSPFGTHTVFGIIMTLVVQVASIQAVITIVITADVYCLVATQQIVLELRLLSAALKDLPNRALREYKKRYGSQRGDLTQLRNNTEFINCYRTCLKQNAIHYHNIITCFGNIASTFSFPMFIIFSLGGLIVALSATSVISGNSLVGPMISSTILCVAEVVNLYFFSWCGEQIREESENLRFAIYDTEWIFIRKNEVIYLRIMISRANNLLELMAGIIPANFGTFADIMNTAYSFCNLFVASRAESST